MIEVDLSIRSENQEIPSAEQISAWIDKVFEFVEYDTANQSLQVSVSTVSSQEIQELNRDYRQKDKPTNVLSFPYQPIEGVPFALLGDLVVCPQVVEQEAKEQDKPVLFHWKHMIVHGTLHLIGYDHTNDEDAEMMESLEIDILNQLGVSNPYAVPDIEEEK